MNREKSATLGRLINAFINEKGYTLTEAIDLAQKTLEHFEEDRGRCERPIKFFYDKVLPKEEWLREYLREEEVATI